MPSQRQVGIAVRNKKTPLSTKHIKSQAIAALVAAATLIGGLTAAQPEPYGHPDFYPSPEREVFAFSGGHVVRLKDGTVITPKRLAGGKNYVTSGACGDMVVVQGVPSGEKSNSKVPAKAYQVVCESSGSATVRERWSTGLSWAYSTAPVIHDGLVYYADSPFTLAMINLTDSTVLQAPTIPDSKKKIGILTRMDQAVAGTLLVLPGEPGLCFAPVGRSTKPGPVQKLPFSLNPPAFAGDRLYVTGQRDLICLGSCGSKSLTIPNRRGNRSRGL